MARDVRVNIVGDTRSLERAVARADDRLEHLGTSARRMQTALAAALAGGAAIRGVQSIVRTYEGYDTALRDVGAVSDTSGRKLEAMGDIARKVGLDTNVGAKASTGAMAELAKAGLKTAEIGPALSGTLALAQAGSLDTADAAEAAANALGQFGLKGKDAGKVADALANAANQTTGDVSDFAMALSQGGGAAKAAGLSFDDTVLALSELQRGAVKGSDAGTSLKSALTQVANPTTQSAAAMKRLGIDFFDAHENIKSVSEISGMLNDKLGGLTKKQRLATLSTIAGTDGMRALNAMSQMTAAQSEALGEKLRKQGSAAETAKAKQSGFLGSMNQLRASSEELQIQLGDRLAPRIAGVADELGKLARDPEAQERLMSVLDSGIDTVERFGTALEPVAALAGDLAGVFADLPSGVQQAAIQMTVLTALAGKLGGPVGFGGAGAAASRFRRELREVPADARRAETALAATSTAAVAAPARRPAKAAAAVTMIPAGRLGSTGRDALEMRAITSAEATERATLAQRAQSDAARQAVAARQALAAAEIAEVDAERRAIGARAAPKGAASKAHVAASQQELLAARQTHAAALESATAAKAESAAARQRLTTARTVQRMAASTATQAAASAAVVAPAGGARSRLAGLAGRLPARSGRAAMGGVAAGGIGAALSGGDMLAGALSGAALGSMAGPVGIAAGAVVGAGATALANEFSTRGVKETEAAARKFARDAAGATDRAAAAGFASAPARQIGRGVAGARKAQAGARKDTSLIAGGTTDAYEGAARDILSPLGLMDSRAEVDRKRAKANAQKAAADAKANARLVLTAYEQEIRGYKATNAGAAIRQFSAIWKDPSLPRAAKQQAANTLIAYTRELERAGAAPKGTVDKLIRSLGRRFDGLEPQVRGAGVRSMRELDRAMTGSAIITSAKKTVDKVGAAWKGLLPALKVDSIQSAVSALRSRMADLSRIAKDQSASKVLRDRAARDLPALRKEYDQALGEMSRSMGISKQDARSWSSAFAAATRKARGGRGDVDDLAGGVDRLNRRMRDSRSFARDLAKQYESVGVTAANAQKLVSQLKPPASAFDAPDFSLESFLPRPSKKKKKTERRTGGPISRFAAGGHVDALMSGGEEYLPPDVASRYPAGVLDSIAQIQAPHFARGGPVGRRAQPYGLGGMIVPGPSDRDGTYVPAEDGGFVLTGHGRALRDEMLGFRRGGALRRFAAGGVVRGKVSVFGPPLEGAGTTANGMSSAQAGIALNILPGTDAGWNNATTDRWVKARQRFLVKIAGHQAVLPMIDKGPAGRTGRAIDVTGAGARKLGLNPAKFPTDKTGTAQAVGADGKPSSSRSVVPEKTVVRRNVGKSDTRGGLLEDPYNVGFSSVDLWGSRAGARKYGGLGTSAIREALDSQKDSYTREIQTAREDASSGATDKISKSFANRLKGTAGGKAKLARLTGALGVAQSIASRGLPYTYGGGHGKLGVGSPGLDCSGYVSAILGGGKWISSPMSVQQGSGLYTLGQKGAGQFLTWGVRGSSGKAAHTMAKIGSSYWESGSGHGPRRVSGWASGGKWQYRHMPGYAKGGRVGAAATLARAPRAAAAVLARSGAAALDPRSSDFVGWGFRGGGQVGTARRFRGGGAIRRFGGGGPTRAMTTSLAAVRRSTSDVNLDAFDRAIGAAGIARVEAMRADLLAKARRGGDKQAVARIQAAISVIEVDIAGRIQEKLSGALGDRANFDQRKRLSQHAMAMEGVDESSAAGLQRTTTTNETDLDVDKANRKTLVEGRAAAKRELRKATSAQGRETLANKIKEFGTSIAEIDERVLGTNEQIEAAKRALPQARAADRVQGLEFGAAMAGLTPDTADDRANLVEQQREWGDQLREAIKLGPAGQKWATEAANTLAGINTSIAGIDERDAAKPREEASKRYGQWDLADAKAALTDDTIDDDRAALEGRKAQQEADYQVAAADPTQVDWQIELLRGIKATKDAIAGLGAGAKERDDALIGLVEQMTENQQKIINGSAISRDAFASAVAAAAGGWIGQSVTRGAATPSFAGNGVNL